MLNPGKFLTYVFTFSAAILLGIAAESRVQTDERSIGFSYAEATRLLNRNVRSLCNSKTIRKDETFGRTVAIEKFDHDSGFVVAIEWQNSMRGRQETIFSGKETFQRCIEFADN